MTKVMRMICNHCDECRFEWRSPSDSPCKECLDMAAKHDIEDACFQDKNEEEEDEAYRLIGPECFLYCDTDSIYYISTPENEARLDAANKEKYDLGGTE